MVIADSSVWIHFLRTPETVIGQEMARLLRADEVALVGIILTEVLQGAGNQSDFEALLLRMNSLSFVAGTRQAWVEAGLLSLELRRQGMLIPLTDLVIGAVALEGDHEVYTLDQHFQRIPNLRLHGLTGST